VEENVVPAFEFFQRVANIPHEGFDAPLVSLSWLSSALIRLELFNAFV